MKILICLSILIAVSCIVPSGHAWLTCPSIRSFAHRSKQCGPANESPVMCDPCFEECVQDQNGNYGCRCITTTLPSSCTIGSPFCEARFNGSTRCYATRCSTDNDCENSCANRCDTVTGNCIARNVSRICVTPGKTEYEIIAPQCSAVQNCTVDTIEILNATVNEKYKAMIKISNGYANISNIYVKYINSEYYAPQLTYYYTTDFEPTQRDLSVMKTRAEIDSNAPPAITCCGTDYLNYNDYRYEHCFYPGITNAQAANFSVNSISQFIYSSNGPCATTLNLALAAVKDKVFSIECEVGIPAIGSGSQRCPFYVYTTVPNQLFYARISKIMSGDIFVKHIYALYVEDIKVLEYQEIKKLDGSTVNTLNNITFTSSLNVTVDFARLFTSADGVVSLFYYNNTKINSWKMAERFSLHPSSTEEGGFVFTALNSYDTRHIGTIKTQNPNNFKLSSPNDILVYEPFSGAGNFENAFKYDASIFGGNNPISVFNTWWDNNGGCPFPCLNPITNDMYYSYRLLNKLRTNTINSVNTQYKTRGFNYLKQFPYTETINVLNRNYTATLTETMINGANFISSNVSIDSQIILSLNIKYSTKAQIQNYPINGLPFYTTLQTNPVTIALIVIGSVAGAIMIGGIAFTVYYYRVLKPREYQKL